VDLNFKNGDLKVDFSGSKLFQGETDGSSFPNGSLSFLTTIIWKADVNEETLPVLGTSVILYLTRCRTQ